MSAPDSGNNLPPLPPEPPRPSWFRTIKPRMRADALAVLAVVKGGWDSLRALLVAATQKLQTFNQWISSQARMPAWLSGQLVKIEILGLLGAGVQMIQLEEYVFAIIFWFIAALIWFAKAVTWNGMQSRPITRRLIKSFHSLLVITVFVLLVIWTDIKRGDKVWTAFQKWHLHSKPSESRREQGGNQSTNSTAVTQQQPAQNQTQTQTQQPPQQPSATTATAPIKAPPHPNWKSPFGPCKYSLKFRQTDIPSILGSPFGQAVAVTPREIKDDVFPFVRFRATEPITSGIGLGVIVGPNNGDPKAAGINITSGQIGVMTERDGTAELWIEDQQKFVHAKEVVVLLYSAKPFKVLCAEQLSTRQFKLPAPSVSLPAPMKDPIHWSPKAVPSDNKEWKFRTLLTIQTDEEIQNPNFKIVCDAPCSFGSFDMGVNSIVGTNRAADDRTVEIGIRQAFTPRTPLTVVLYGNDAFQVVKVERIY